MGIGTSKPTPTVAAPASRPLGWSDLPTDLADLVLLQLPSHADRVRFGSVCRQWRYAATATPPPPLLPRALPWLNFLDGTLQSFPDGKLHRFRLNQDTICAGSYGGLLLFRRPGHSPSRRHFLNNPLSGEVIRLPSHCDEPARFHHRGSSGGSSTTDFYIRQVIVCTSDVIVARISYKYKDNDVIACCHRGTSPSWSTGLWQYQRYHDMAVYDGKLYTVSGRGNLFAHEFTLCRDTGQPIVSDHVTPVIKIDALQIIFLDGSYAIMRCSRSYYLVVSSHGKLWMVRWIIPYADQPSDHLYIKLKMTMEFRVFEADMETGRWTEVESLGDEAIFVSKNCSRAVRASIYCGYIEAGKIYFADYDLESWCSRPTCSDACTCGVYDLRSKTFSPCGPNISHQSKATWYFPGYAKPRGSLELPK